MLRSTIFRLTLALVAGGVLALGRPALAAETVDPVGMTTTVVVLKTDSDEPIPIQTTFQHRPPTIVVEFPKQRVLGALPERSAIDQGVIQTITARYEGRTSASASRFLQSLRVGLSAPFTYRVRSESGRVVVEIDHPKSVTRTDVEVGLRGGTIIGGLRRNPVSERFRAMQEAMARATPTAWTLQLAPSTEGLSAGGTTTPTPRIPEGISSGIPTPESAHAPSLSRHAPVSSPIGRAAPGRGGRPSPALSWVIWALGAGMIGAGSWWWSRGGTASRLFSRSAAPTGSGTRLPSGVVLIDQLVWRSFERQGYQLVLETERMHPPLGTLRVVMKDGIKSALLFVGHGQFFEKQTVQRFIHAMGDAGVAQGILVAAGSFTVPAQRIAKEHQISLIGREQLIELLSSGAGSEHFTKQLEQSQARLEEARETLRRYAEELDTFRRQRNEASWYLGEERAKSGKLEAHVAAVTLQLRRYEADIQRWEQETSTLRTQWEESQWYLGESRERVRHLESQVAGLQEISKRVEAAERAQADTNWNLSEERVKTETLAAQLAALQKELEASAARERVLEQAIGQLKQEISVFHAFGERRSHTRVRIPEAVVDIQHGRDGQATSGSLRDLSSAGFGLDSEQEPVDKPSVRVHLNLPGHQPIASRARLKWQQAEGKPTRYQSGYRLIGLSPATRALIDQLVEEFRTTRSS